MPRSRCQTYSKEYRGRHRGRRLARNLVTRWVGACTHLHSIDLRTSSFSCMQEAPLLLLAGVGIDTWVECQATARLLLKATVTSKILSRVEFLLTMPRPGPLSQFACARPSICARTHSTGGSHGEIETLLYGHRVRSMYSSTLFIDLHIYISIYIRRHSHIL